MNLTGLETISIYRQPESHQAEDRKSDLKACYKFKGRKFWKNLGKNSWKKNEFSGQNGDIGDWGHEYVRHLAGEIGRQFHEPDINKDEKVNIVIRASDFKRI